MSNTVVYAIIFSLLLGTSIYFKNKEEKYSKLKDDTVILAFGDSLTRGYGAKEGYSYPDILRNRTGFKVINAGVNGETSSEGLARLPLFLKDKPTLVVLCHGGNDILQKLSKAELKANLISMVKLIQESGAVVVLVGVPSFGTFGLSVLDIYYEVADEMDVLLESDVISEIQLSRSLKSDYVHPNEKGYELMAEHFITLFEDNNLR